MKIVRNIPYTLLLLLLPFFAIAQPVYDTVFYHEIPFKESYILSEINSNKNNGFLANGVNIFSTFDSVFSISNGIVYKVLKIKKTYAVVIKVGNKTEVIYHNLSCPNVYEGQKITRKHFLGKADIFYDQSIFYISFFVKKRNKLLSYGSHLMAIQSGVK